MRLDPEDYAFVTSYTTLPMRKTISELAGGVKGRILSVVISLAIALFFWWSAGRPSDFATITEVALGVVAAVLVGLAVLAIATRKAVGQPTTGLWGYAFADLALLALLSAPGVMLVWRLLRFDRALRPLMEYEAVAAAFPTFAPSHHLTLWLVLALAVIAGLWLTAFGALAYWAVRPASLGIPARRLATVACWASLILTSPAIYLAASARGEMESAMSVAEAAPLIAYVWPRHTFVWVLLTGLIITIVNLGLGTFQLASAGLLVAGMATGPALRVDPIGVVLDDSGRAQRIAWPQVGVIGAKAHADLAGNELVVSRPGLADWRVPFRFLDVMPGTIDSAIRAHTMDERTLDLTRLDKVA
jgi:hypothetical protein